MGTFGRFRNYGKAWVWNLEDYDAVYGTGGWLTELEPSWDVTPVEELEDLDCELIFDLNGGPNLTKIDADGNILKKGGLPLICRLLRIIRIMVNNGLSVS